MAEDQSLTRPLMPASDPSQHPPSLLDVFRYAVGVYTPGWVHRVHINACLILMFNPQTEWHRLGTVNNEIHLHVEYYRGRPAANRPREEEG